LSKFVLSLLFQVCVASANPLEEDTYAS